MAASSENVAEWRVLLNSLKIFHKLRKTHQKSEESEPRNLLSIQDGRIFVWDGESRLLTVNLFEVFSMDTNATELESQSDISPFQGDLQEQSLLCTDTPFFKVEQVSFNATGQQVLLWGKRGASILHLPRKQGKKGAFQGGQERINCRTVPIAERFFSTNPSVSLLQASWHPGSESASHVVLLTSDNTIRIFDTSNTEKAVQVTKLGGGGGPSYSLNSTHSAFEVALGDIAVAFDFGIHFESADQKDTLYPVYILRGNGDVFMLVTSLTSRRYQRARPCGPIIMHPPAEDNYGLDACSISCLHSNPPVLVIATSTGFLHHCIMLDSRDDEETGSSSFQASTAVSVFSERSSRESTLPEEQNNLSLFVYESVELSFTPVLSDNEDLDVAYPIMLIKDSQSEHCYYCCHGAGLHSISLPWLEHMERFCKLDDEAEDEVSEVQRDQPCLVQHLICTKPSDSCPPAPILGLADLVDPLLGNVIICLSSEGECFVLPHISESVGTPASLLSEKPSEEVTSPLRQLKPFQHHIRTLLLRDISNPILKTSNKTELSAEQSFKLLQRATRILREEYIMKQDQAREEIEKRAKILMQQKDQQVADLRECSQMEAPIKEHASELAERYEEAQDKQEELLQRVGVVLHSLQNQLPTLSGAEQGMKAELMDMEDKLKYMEMALDQVKTKFNQHKDATESIDPRRSPGLSTTQQKQLRELLKAETTKITELIAEVKSLTTVVAS